ncbi:MAG: kinase [Beijerinckiaceae bacterium]|nr:kinase [Beijerinckiaceae bacterium]
MERHPGTAPPINDEAQIEEMLIETVLGVGTCEAHHGELLQGMFYNNNGDITRGLVTLPCPIFHTTAKFLPTPQPELHVLPSKIAKRKAARAAELTLEFTQRQGSGGLLFLGNDSPEGWGLGSSTTDVVSTIRAVADAFSISLSSDEVARIAVKAEVASDSIMYADAVLFAQREGYVIESYDRELPPMEIVGFNTDPTFAGIDTLLHPPANYSWDEIEAFRPLRGLLKRGIFDQDPNLIGKVATESARLNQKFLPKPRFADILQLGEEIGAVGVQVAHSGSVVGIIFDPVDNQLTRKMAKAVAALRQLGFPACHRFRVGAI